LKLWSLFLLLGVVCGFSAAAAPPPPPVKTFASTALAVDEILLEIVPAAQIAALSHLAWNPMYSNIAPAKLKGVATFGQELERLVVMHPTLVIMAAYNRAEMARVLNAAGIATVTLADFNSLADLRGNITTLGKLTGSEKAAAVLLEKFNARLAAVARTMAASTRKPTVLSYDPDGSVMGARTIFNDAVAAAGGRNLAAELIASGWSQLSLEKLATLNPDFVIAPGDEEQRQEQVAAIQKRPGWQGLAAVRGGRIILIPSRLLFTASHYTADLIEVINRALHAPK